MSDSDCPFCRIASEESRDWVKETEHFVAFRDQYPVSDGHTLVIPRAHTSAFGQLPTRHGEEFLSTIQAVRDDLLATHGPDGFNIGLNDGEAAGQTIEHLHWHVIPRYEGDVEDPEGGVRGVIPDRRRYR